ncbi:response regulator [Dankookia rubra]|uniref:histidine kinase n=1 Tax=Dankookia rubra TaxID=1442381 RepID=A0A4R5Q992_9PROT|nr:CHASE3 domain-containing protein [Dankookia rubra]TDH59542.1 response regulator [Dankookia rubra]
MTTQLARRAHGLALIAVAGFLAVVGILLWEQFDSNRGAIAWVGHTHVVRDTARQLQIVVRDAETGQRGYLLTGRDDYLRPYEDALGQITLLQGDLRRLTADNPAQQDRLRGLAGTLQRKLEEMAQAIGLRRDQGLEAAQSLMQTDLGQTLMAAIETVLGDLNAEEERLLATRIAAVDRSQARTRWLTLAAILASILLMLVAGRLLDRARQRLQAAEAEQRRLADQLRGSLDSISQGLAVFDATGQLQRWNVNFPAQMQLTGAVLQPGLDYAALAAWVDQASGSADMLESAAQIRHGRGGRSAREPVVYERRREVDDRSLEFHRTPMPDGGFVLTVTDITERVRAAASARDAQRMQAMGQLTGGIAHDFNNLLAVVLGNLELIRPKLPADSPLLPRVERAIWGARRGASLTSQLLAFARKQPLATAPIDVSAMLPDMATLLRRTLGAPIEVRVVDAAGLWPAMADATQVESALLNLALNARDAMPNGGRLTIEVANKVLDADYAARHAEVAPGDYVMLAVSDTGTGMTPEVLERVFEPFFTTKEPGRGTGLGLAMVFGFAKQSGGHVKIYSEPGEGTTVRLYLPRAVGVAAAVQRPSAPVELPRGDAAVLVLEDDAQVREVTATMLRELGYRVLEAGDGPTALRLAAEGVPIDLLLADVVLPGGMKGSEVARRLTELRPGLRVLFMSGYTENAIVHHGRLDDGVQLIGKPFSREQLARKVVEALGWPSAAAAPPVAANIIELGARARGGGPKG